MKTATVRDLRNRFSAISAWLLEGETVILTRRGVALGRIVPEPKNAKAAAKTRRALFEARFASPRATPKRDLSGVFNENRGNR
jgi:antitoxin (DNA-binding transcriptional repressor) of toxin-antitoxin stability system